MDAPAKVRALWQAAVAPLVGLAAALGALTGVSPAPAILTMAVVGALAGYCYAVSLRLSIAGLSVALSLIISQGLPLDAADALPAMLLATAGGLLQPLFSLLVWTAGDRTEEGGEKGWSTPAAIAELRANRTLRSESARHALRFGSALAAGVAATGSRSPSSPSCSGRIPGTRWSTRSPEERLQYVLHPWEALWMRIKIALLLVLTALLALFAAGSAQAALTVSNQNDSGAGSLRQTIAEAGPGETINLPAGTYSLTSGPLKIEKKSLTILGHDDADTTIRAAGAFRVIEFFGPLDATISGVTIRDGNIVGTVAFGAGIFGAESNLNLRDVVVTNNTGNVNGAPGVNGGVAEGAGVWVTEGSLNLIDSKVTANTATAVGGSGKNGGVVLGVGVWVAEGAATVTNSTIAGNLGDVRGGQGPPAVGQRGGVAEAGGIWVGEGPLSLRDSVVSGNTVLANSGPGDHGGVAEGGGVWVGTGDLAIADSTINSNRADAEGGQGPADKEQRGGVSEGGGVWLGEGVLTVLDTEISGNSASSVGGPGGNGGVVEAGGLWAVPSGPQASSILGSTVAGNTINGSAGAAGSNGVVEGGGIWLATEEGPLSMARTTIANNVARHQATTGGVAQGGGLWAVGAKAGTVTLLSTTIAGNRLEAAAGPSNEGGNLFWAEKVNIRNSIVANGVGPPGSENCSEPPEPPEVPSLGFNLDSLDQCGFKAPGDMVNANPLLGPLQLNGGRTQTMIPAASGAAVDQGVASGLTSDQRGVVRPIDLPSIPNSAAPGADGSDIGAVEFQPSNAFALGKLTRNKKKGTATLSVILPSPSGGTLTLTGNGLTTQTLPISGQTEVQLKVAASSKKIKKALRKKGKRKVGINVTYAPPGISATTQSLKAKLVKKKRKHKKKHRKPGKR